jgi:hypothetical protein
VIWKGTIWAGILISLFSLKTLASKIDTIYFQNGDRITAEVKSLENNRLKLSTTDAGTVYIEWNKVDSVKILSTMRILLSNGTILYGTLMASGQERGCYIWQRDGNPRLVRLEEIVQMSRLENLFLSRFQGTLSTGFSYTKASDLTQFNFNGSIKYTANKNQFDFHYDGIFTRDSTKYTQRQSGGVTFRRLLPRRYFLLSTLLGESNSEQELDLRTSAGIGFGNSLVYTNSSHFFVAAGITGNREWSSDIVQFNLEGRVTLNYSVFIYDSPEVTFDIRADLIPSINDPGRVRSQVDSNLRWEIFHDFYLKWNFYFSYDSRPLSETASKYDWAISLLGLEYKL